MAVKVVEYGMPTLAVGVAPLIAIIELTILKEKFTELLAPGPSVTVTVKLYVPITSGVPLITPVKGSIETPGGNPVVPPVIAQL